MYSPESVTMLLNLNGNISTLTGTPKEKADKLMEMFNTEEKQVGGMSIEGVLQELSNGTQEMLSWEIGEMKEFKIWVESTNTKIEFKFFGDLEKLSNALYEAFNEQEVFISGTGSVVTVEWNKTENHRQEIDKVKEILVELGEFQKEDLVYVNYMTVKVNIV